jgi:hypothetical protein
VGPNKTTALEACASFRIFTLRILLTGGGGGGGGILDCVKASGFRAKGERSRSRFYQL